MAQLNQTGSAVVDDNNTQIGVIQLEPSSARNGLFTLKGEETTSSVITTNGIPQATVSIRPGRSVDIVNNVKRVKRRFTMKCRLPVMTPGVVSGVAGQVLDFIDLDLVLSTPVEATESEIRTMLTFANMSNGVLQSNWVEDMYLKGYEPY